MVPPESSSKPGAQGRERVARATLNDDVGTAAPMSMRLTINGEERESNSDPLSPLVDVLRDEFFLTGAKPVCREGFCGACTVLLDGEPAVSCLVPVGLAVGCEITTVESLARDGVLNRPRHLGRRFDVETGKSRRHQARRDRFAVQQNHTGAAKAFAAHRFGAG